MQLFQRTAVVVVNGIRVDQLRIAFKVVKDGTTAPNTADVTITNLSLSARTQMEQKGAPLILQAGYAGQNTTLFSGRVRTCDHVRQGADWNTVIKSGDGEEELGFATISQTWRPGVPISAVLNTLVRQLGLDPGDSPAVFAQIQGTYINGCTLVGKVKGKLGEILAAQGFEWSVQDGRVQVTKKGDTTRETAIVLGPDTGLLGSPSHVSAGKSAQKDSSGETAAALAQLNSVRSLATAASHLVPRAAGVLSGVTTTPGQSMQTAKAGHVKFESLLMPFKPGRLVRLQSEGIKGDMRCIRVEHEGDTHGTAWVSRVEAKPV